MKTRDKVALSLGLSIVALISVIGAWLIGQGIATRNAEAKSVDFALGEPKVHINGFHQAMISSPKLSIIVDRYGIRQYRARVGIEDSSYRVRFINNRIVDSQRVLNATVYLLDGVADYLLTTRVQIHIERGRRKDDCWVHAPAVENSGGLMARCDEPH